MFNYRVVINPDGDFPKSGVEKVNVSAIAVAGTELGAGAWWFKTVEEIIPVGVNQRVVINPDIDFAFDTPYKPVISADSVPGASLITWARWWFRIVQDLHGRRVVIDPDADFDEYFVYTVLASGQSYSGGEIVDFSWWFETAPLVDTPFEFTGEWVNLGEDGTVLKGQLRRFLKLISFALDETKGLVDAFPIILNIDKTDADYLPLIAVLVGIDFNYDIPIPRQREEIKRAVEVYKVKGTLPGIKTFGRTISGVPVDIQEWPKNILMSNDLGRLSAQVTSPEIIEKTGLPGDQCMSSLDFSDDGDYWFDKFGIYFYLSEKGGLLKSVGEKILRLLSKYIPASTLGKLIFIDHTYQLTTSGQQPPNIYHAFGTGDEAWDDQLVQPDPDQTKLVNEIYRRVPDSIVYLDENGQVTTTPTNRIRALTILNNTQPEIDGNYIREQGLFGNASEENDSGTLLGVANHKGQWKTDGYRIRKTMQLTFQ